MADNRPSLQSFKDAQGKWDDITIEAPLTMSAGDWKAVTLRTPGRDEDLIRGLLISEGLVTDPSHIESIHVHADPGHGSGGMDRVEARLSTPVLKHIDRAFEIRPSCGLCGQEDLNDSRLALQATDTSASWDVNQLPHYFNLLSKQQPLFTATGACHAAALIDSQGNLLVAAEDIGRHNAVDKVIGTCTQNVKTLASCLLLLSGRSGYELIAKAIRSNIPAVASVGGTSSAAIQLAKGAKLGLAAFCRGDHCRIYENHGQFL